MLGKLKKLIDRATKTESIWSLLYLIRDAFGSPIGWLFTALLTSAGAAMTWLSSANEFIAAQGLFGYAVVFVLSVLAFLACGALLKNIRGGKKGRNAQALSDLYEAIETRFGHIEARQHGIADLGDRISSIEKMLTPKPKGLLAASLLTGHPETSRLDQIAEEIAEVGRVLAELPEKLDQNRKEMLHLVEVISRAVRAKYAMEAVIQADETVRRLGPRLLGASKSDYADERAWRAEYEQWTIAFREIDAIMGHWSKGFTSYLEISRTDFENGGPLPPVEGCVTVANNGNRYQTVHLVSQRYAGAGDRNIRYLEDLAYRLPM